MRRLLWLVVGLGGLLSGPAWADTLWLRNGDIITGVLRVKDGVNLRVETDYAGVITVRQSAVRTLETSSPVLVRERGRRGSMLVHLRPAEVGRVSMVSDGTPQVVALEDLTRILVPRRLLEDRIWEVRLNLGFDLEKGENEIDERDLALSSLLRHGEWRHDFQGEYRRREKDGSRTRDNHQYKYAVDYFLGSRFFWQGQAQFLEDRVEDMARRLTLGSGPGYQFWDNELGHLSLATLVNYDHYETRSGNETESVSVSLKWDYRRALYANMVEFFTLGEVAFPMSRDVSETYDTELGLRFRLTRWATLNLKAEYDYINGDGANLDVSAYTLGLGIILK